MTTEKLRFLRHDFIRHLKALDPETPPLWGKMNVQQMIEHMSESVRIANGHDRQVLVTALEKVPAMKEFLMSEKEFRPNTKNSLLPETPEPPKKEDVRTAIAQLETEIQDFVNYFECHPEEVLTNPFFGDLNFEEWIQMLHKHAIHHLKQFGWRPSVD